MRVMLSLLGVFLTASVPASSQLASAGEFLACRNVEPESSRLECYDGIADRLMAEPEAAVAPAVMAAPKTPEAAATEEKVEEKADEIVARVTRVVKDNRGRLTIVLDNQQRWRQVSSERFQVKAGDEIVIRKAILGSFVLQQRSGGRKTKVRQQD